MSPFYDYDFRPGLHGALGTRVTRRHRRRLALLSLAGDLSVCCRNKVNGIRAECEAILFDYLENTEKYFDNSMEIIFIVLR